MFKWIFKILKWIFGIWNNLDEDTKDAILKVLLKIWEWIFGSYYEKKMKKSQNQKKKISQTIKEKRNENS